MFSGVTTLAWLQILAGLLLPALLFTLSSRLRGAARTAARIIAVCLVLRAIALGNPWVWEVYAALLRPDEVGWRQYDAVLLKRDSFRRQEPTRYLVMGSSQTAAIYGRLARERADVEMLSVAAMQPIDFLLYDDLVARHRPATVVLYLSNFDISRRPSPDALVIAPPQGADLLRVAAHLRSAPDREAYRETIAAMVAAEFFPEYKYRYVFRGLGTKLLWRVARTAGRAEARPRERPSEAQMIQWARESFRPEYASLNLRILEDFITRTVERGASVVIVEGHFHPAVMTPEIAIDAHASATAVRTLAAAQPQVAYVTRERVMSFVESDYRDLSHVSDSAGYEFATRLLALLDTGSLPASAGSK